MLRLSRNSKSKSYKWRVKVKKISAYPKDYWDQFSKIIFMRLLRQLSNANILSRSPSPNQILLINYRNIPRCIITTIIVITSIIIMLITIITDKTIKSIFLNQVKLSFSSKAFSNIFIKTSVSHSNTLKFETLTFFA